MECPCKGCDNRSARCHAECLDYAVWSDERSEEREKDHKRRNAEGEYLDHVHKVAYSIKVRKKGGRKLNGWR